MDSKYKLIYLIIFILLLVMLKSYTSIESGGHNRRGAIDIPPEIVVYKVSQHDSMRIPRTPILPSRRLGPAALTVNVYEGDEDIPGRLSPSTIVRPPRCNDKCKRAIMYISGASALLAVGSGVGAVMAIHFAHC